MYPSAANATVDTDLSIGGGVRIGWASDACAAGIAGAIRYNSASSGTVDLCNGSNWITVGPGGGGGTPAGADREIQFNSGGSFAASSRMTYDGDGAIYIQGDSADGYNTYALVKAGGATWNTNYITGQKSGGTLASPSNVGWPDTLLVISGDGWGNGAFYGAAEIRFETDGNTGFADMPGAILFRTTPDGASGLQDRMKIGNQGDVTMYGTGALKIHSGTTAERPGTPANGMVRYNTTTGKFEGYQAGAWVDVIGGGGGSIDALSDGKSDYTTDFNLWLGQNAGNAIASGGIGNLAIGQDAADALTTGDDNLAIGQESMSTLTTGTSNVAIGRYAMRSGDATASENTYVGVASGQNVTGQYNTALGFATLSGGGGITGSNNVALGRSTMRYKNGSYNVAVGADAMSQDNSGSVADGNTAVGNVALQAVTEGDGNTAIGSDAGLIVSTGSNNTLIGFLAADALTTGSSNIIIGANTDAPSATGSNQLNIGNTIYGDLSTGKIGIGTAAPSYDLSFANGADRIIGVEDNTNPGDGYSLDIGAGSPAPSSSDSNGGGVYISGGSSRGDGGSQIGFYVAGQNQGSGTTVRNPAMIASIFDDFNEGSFLKILGGSLDLPNIYLEGSNGGSIRAGTAYPGGPLITWTNTGAMSIGGLAAASADLITIPGVQSQSGDYLNITSYGGSAGDILTVTSAGAVGIGNNAPSVALDVTGDIEYTGVISDVSDLRLKDNIVELDSALGKIMALNPVSFTMKSDPDKRVELGFIAQDVEKIFPELVITAKDEHGTKSLNYTGMIAPMVQAMQEQQRMLEAQQAQIDLLVKQNAELKAMMEEMRK